MNMRPAAAGMDEVRRMVRLAHVLRERTSDAMLAQELVARASACIADGDVLTTAVRRHQVRAFCSADAAALLTMRPVARSDGR